MTRFNNVHAAALAAGASLVRGGFARLKRPDSRPRRAVTPRRVHAPRRIGRGMEQRTPRAETRVRPAAKVVQIANRAAAAAAPAHAMQASLDIGTLEELLAGLFSLRSDLTALVAELSEMHDNPPHAA